jgi:Domain of unknown function (DUF4440)
MARAATRFGLPPSGRGTKSAMKVREELLKIEEGFWHAAGDSDRYAEHLAADAVHVFPGWGVVSRDAVLAGVAGADAWSSFAIEDPAVLMLSDNTAALVYRTHARRQDQPPYEAAITSVYRRHNATWELVVHQQTPLTRD